MVTNNMQQQIHGKYTSPGDLMDEIISVVYPEMFLQLIDMHSNIRLLPVTRATTLLQTLYDGISSAMECMYIKEKQDLFPYIRILESRQELSPDCLPFKNVTAHYKAMEKMIGEMKNELGAWRAPDTTGILLGHISASLKAFEKKHIFFQLIKDKYLFVSFRKCEGCNSLPECLKETASMTRQVYSA